MSASQRPSAPANDWAQRDTPTYAPQEWDNGSFSIQSWLQRTPWKHLADTEYGCPNDAPAPDERLFDDPLLMQIYKLDLATFLTAERISMTGISKLVSAAPDEASQVFLATQAVDEARHYEIFCRRLADVGVTPEGREQLMAQVTTPAMQTFYDLICEQVDTGNFIAAMLAHNVILEGMAYPVYRYETRYWSRLDPGFSRMIHGAFADEVHHVRFGEALMREHSRGSVESRNKLSRLAAEFHDLMEGVFDGVLTHYIGLYQEAANAHMDLMGDLEIFPGHTMATTSEEEQVRILLAEVEEEHSKRLARIGLERA